MSPTTPPGKTREKIFQYVRDRLLQGRPPTVREVQKHFGFQAVQTAQAHLRRLVAEGRLVKAAGKARGYALPGFASEPPTTFVPLLGRIQAGGLSAAIEDCEGYIPVQARTRAARSLSGPPKKAGTRPRGDAATQRTTPSGSGRLFALRVQGESMTGVGILPGDVVIVRSQPTAQPGDIVVALIGDEATVKTLRLRRGRIELCPENPAYEPIVPGPDECTILGTVIESRRYIDPPMP